MDREPAVAVLACAHKVDEAWTVQSRKVVTENRKRKERSICHDDMRQVLLGSGL